MIIEIDELDFSRYSPEQLAQVRPLMEDVAAVTRRNLRLLEGALGVETNQSDLERDYERLCLELHEARALADALRDDLAIAHTRIEDLEEQISEHQDDEQDALFGSVGLTVNAHAVVVSAARRALLGHLHPDRAPEGKKAAATVNFQAASAAFDRIAELRRV